MIPPSSPASSNFRRSFVKATRRYRTSEVFPRTPNLVEELLMGEDRAGTAHQNLKESELRRGEVHLVPVRDERAGVEPKRERPVFDLGFGFIRLRGRLTAAQHRTDSCDELLNREGLRHVVVRTQVEAAQLRRAVRLRRNEDDRNGIDIADLRRALNPSIPGIITSKRIRSGRGELFMKISTASSPSAALITSNPLRSRFVAISRRILVSSSTTMMRGRLLSFTCFSVWAGGTRCRHAGSRASYSPA